MSNSLENKQNLRWQAVQEKSEQAEDFIYAVLTTGIYCRCGCPSRLPKRENVAFFDTPQQARDAGYRACKRCDPDESGLSSTERLLQKITHACATLEQADAKPTLNDLAQQAGMSRYHFQRMFKLVTGTTPMAYGRAHRMKALQRNLRDPKTTITDAIHSSGYGSSSRFYEKATRLLGMTPTQYRKGGQSMRIVFAVGECLLGSLLVACTDKGICAIGLADSPDELLTNLQDTFTEATLIGGDDQFEKLVARVVAFIDQPTQSLDLPLDIQGTAFQERVWSALCDIPPGSTASYKDIAVSLGMENSHRAVANACGSNRLAVAIPCHRVVRSDGALSGYRWGIERKRKLLALEATAQTDDQRLL